MPPLLHEAYLNVMNHHSLRNDGTGEEMAPRRRMIPAPFSHETLKPRHQPGSALNPICLDDSNDVNDEDTVSLVKPEPSRQPYDTPTRRSNDVK